MMEDSSSERPMVWERCKPPRLNCVEGIGVGIEPYVRILSFSSPSLVLSYIYICEGEVSFIEESRERTFSNVRRISPPHIST